MTTIVRFEVPGKPAGKARPRVLKSGHAYTPDPGDFVITTTKFAYDAAKSGGWELTEEPVGMVISILRRMPKGWSKKRKAERDGQPAPGRPDFNNVCGAIFDALEGIFYHNDAQVTNMQAGRVWSDRDMTTVVVYLA